jgi:hypothetical protein
MIKFGMKIATPLPVVTEDGDDGGLVHSCPVQVQGHQVLYIGSHQ